MWPPAAGLGGARIDARATARRRRRGLLHPTETAKTPRIGGDFPTASRRIRRLHGKRRGAGEVEVPKSVSASNGTGFRVSQSLHMRVYRNLEAQKMLSGEHWLMMGFRSIPDNTGLTILGGAAGGIVSACLLRFYDRIVYRKRQREQIRHLGELFEKAREKLFSRGNEPRRGEPDKRWQIYKKLHEDASSALRERCTCMSYDQIHSIRNVLMSMDLLIKYDGDPRGVSLPVYQRFFEKLEEIRWLRLPRKQPDAKK